MGGVSKPSKISRWFYSAIATPSVAATVTVILVFKRHGIVSHYAAVTATNVLS